MHVIWHEAVSPYSDPCFLLGFDQKSQISTVVTVRIECLESPIATLSYVMGKIDDFDAGNPGHGRLSPFAPTLSLVA